MKNHKHFLAVIVSFIGCISISKAQLVTDKFDKLHLSENFDSTTSYWTTMANAENLFIVQEGEYILNRKSLTAPFAIIADYENNLSTFRLVSSIRLDKSVNDDGSVGIIFMAQPGGSGGFIFEINKLKQFRIRKISGGTYKYITGDSKNSGWISSKFINESNAYNLIEIKTSNRNYDISVNNNYLISFTEIEYKSGRMGLVIGAGTKARVDFIYLFSSSKTADSTAVTENGIQPAQPAEATPDIIELTESIIKLKTQFNKLTEENEDLRKTFEAMKSDDDEVENEKKRLHNTITELQNSIKKSSASYDSLVKANTELMKYKEMVAGNENSDLIISLSKSLKKEKEANDLLKKQNKDLTDSLSTYTKGQKSGQNKQEVKPAEKPKQSGENSFALPTDGK